MDLDPVVVKTRELVREGWNEHERRVRRYDKAYDVYRASEPNAPGVEPWQSKLRIKFGAYVINTELVNIAQGLPRCKVRPRKPESETGATAMQSALDYYVKEDRVAQKTPEFAMCGLVFGVAIAKNHWLYRKAKRPRKVYRENPFDPAVPSMSVEEIEMVTADRPSFEVWNPYHAYWEPGARSVDQAGYVVLQSWITKDELLKLRWNPETERGLYHNVDQLLELGDGQKPDQTTQNRAMGHDDGRYKDKFLIEEIWTNDTLVVVGNKSVLLRAQANPYWHGRKPIVIANTMPDLFELEGISETEAVDHIQQALWTVINRRMDQEHLTVMRPLTYREGGILDPRELVLKPRALWPVTDHDDIKQLDISPLPREAYEEEQSLLGHLQTVTGVNSYISGADMSGVDQNTATGITALQGVASKQLQFKAQQLRIKGYSPSFEMWGDMAQQFLDQPIVHKIVGPGSEQQWLEVAPEDIAGHYDYVVEGTEESISEQQERSDAIALMNTFVPLLQQPGLVNIRPILERVAKAYGFENPEELLPAPQPQLPAAAPNGGGQQQPPQMAQLLGGQTMSPQILNAIQNR